VAEHAALLGRTPVGLPHAMVGSAYIFHAGVLRQWNRLDEALELVLQAVRLSEQTETIVTLYIGYTELMRVYLARGEMDAACSAFQHAEELLAKTYSLYRRDVYVIVDWVQFWLASGALDRATHWAQELAQSARASSPFAREREDVAQARILLAQKRPTEALSLLEPLQVIAEKQERLSHVIEMKVLQALAHRMRDEEQEALTVLAQALRLAEPDPLDRGPDHRCHPPPTALGGGLRPAEGWHPPGPELELTCPDYRLRGSPRTRSAMMFRSTSELPASIVLPLERRKPYCQGPLSFS